MTQPQSEIPFVNGRWDSIDGIQRFSHQAMATVFEVFVLHTDHSYVEQAAWAAFDELDRLEAELSRFIDNSDISRINNLSANQSLTIGLDAFECLQVGRSLYTETNGAFDITVGSLMDCWLDENKAVQAPSREKLNLARKHTGAGLLKLDQANRAVELLGNSVKIDLGGIGKGYAVDRMSELLKDWGIDTALVHSGCSSVLAIGSPPETDGWPVTLSNPDNRKEKLASLCLQNRAVSGSGLQKGWHIIDPRTARPVEGKVAAWACAPDAASADALSTAFMVMSPKQVSQYCSTHPDTLAMMVTKDGEGQVQELRVLRYGPWEESGILRQ